MTVLNVNGVPREVDCDPSTPLLWVFREQLELTGTKFGLRQSGKAAIKTAAASGADAEATEQGDA